MPKQAAISKGDTLLPLWSSEEGKNEFFRVAVRLYAQRSAEKKVATNRFNRFCRALPSSGIDVEDIKVALEMEESPGKIPPFADAERYQRVAELMGIPLDGGQMSLPLKEEGEGA